MVCDRSCDFNRAKVIGTIGNTLSYLTESAVRTCGLLITHSYRYANFQHVVFFFFSVGDASLTTRASTQAAPLQGTCNFI